MSNRIAAWSLPMCEHRNSPKETIEARSSDNSTLKHATSTALSQGKFPPSRARVCVCLCDSSGRSPINFSKHWEELTHTRKKLRRKYPLGLGRNQVEDVLRHSKTTPSPTPYMGSLGFISIAAPSARDTWPLLISVCVGDISNGWTNTWPLDKLPTPPYFRSISCRVCWRPDCDA